MRIVYKQDWPDDVAVVAAAHVERLACSGLLPTWVEDVWVYCVAEEDERPARVETAPEYLNVKLTLRPSFLALTPEARDEVLRHEAIHAHLAPLAVAVDDVVDEIEATNAALAKRLRVEIERANECAAVGLEAAIERVMRGDESPCPSK